MTPPFHRGSQRLLPSHTPRPAALSLEEPPASIPPSFVTLTPMESRVRYVGPDRQPCGSSGTEEFPLPKFHLIIDLDLSVSGGFHLSKNGQPFSSQRRPISALVARATTHSNFGDLKSSMWLEVLVKVC